MNQNTRPHTDIRSIYHLPGKTIQFQLDPVSFHAFLGTDTNVPTNQNQILFGLFSDIFSNNVTVFLSTFTTFGNYAFSHTAINFKLICVLVIMLALNLQ